jgi:hypothetical protein
LEGEVNEEVKLSVCRRRSGCPNVQVPEAAFHPISLTPPSPDQHCCTEETKPCSVSARCYSFGAGKTIEGADYRRDYDVTKKHCAETCKLDSCCMAFEWQEENSVCTLKSRSLNGSVSQAHQPDTHFGLCLDIGEHPTHPNPII